jgi:hypothetical protein
VPAPVYTRRLGAIQSTAAGVFTELFRSTGYWVIRDIQFTNLALTPTILEVVVTPLAKAGQYYLWYLKDVPAQATSRVELRQALEPNDSLRIASSSQPWAIAVTGYTFGS